MDTCPIEKLEPFAGQFNTLPVWGRFAQSGRSPVDVFKAFKKLSRHCFILESLEGKERRGRWTFLGFAPKLEFTVENGSILIKNGIDTEFESDNPGAEIDRIIAQNRSPLSSEIFPCEDLPHFTGGLVGYFSFDYVKYSVEKLHINAKGGEFFKDCDLMLFDKLVVWDNLKSLLYIFINIKTVNLAENYHFAINEIESIKRIIDSGAEPDMPRLKLLTPFRELFDKPRYCEMVEKAKKYIFEGDIFQVVLSNQIEAEVEGSIFEVYKILRTANPSPYMFYFSSDDIEIAGASPETLVRLEERSKLRTFPLAGTRRRGATPEEDTLLERELLADPKELAEHNMLVDLGRNDLGRISKFGSVCVERYLELQKFSHVMHIGSTVLGELKEENSPASVISAVLPAGTLSGAPKIRAVEIIDELEDYRRGIYGGAIGYLSLSGELDTCISIRIAYKKNGRVYIRSGAGIVADSIPENEWLECRNKMKAVENALNRAAGMSA